MKKAIILVSLIAACAAAQAQRYPQERRFWADFQVAQSFGLNSWFDAQYLNDRMPSTTAAEFPRMGLNIRPWRHFGFFLNCGLLIYHPPQKGDDNAFDPRDLAASDHTESYFMMDQESLQNDWIDNILGLEAIGGLFGKYPVSPEVDLIPYLGFGIRTIPTKKYRYYFKEEDSSALYSVGGDLGSAGNVIPFVTARLLVSCRLTRKLCVHFGPEYRFHPASIDFTSYFSNCYTGQRVDHTVKGNSVNALGFCVGVSFRFVKDG